MTNDEISAAAQFMEEVPEHDPPSGMPTWSENYCLAGYDPACGVDLFLHIGRWRKDIHLWREIVMIALPDGTVLGARAVGNAHATLRGPGGPCLGVEVVEPGRRLEWKYLGTARRVRSGQLCENRLVEGREERLEFDLTFESTLPVWDIGRSGRQTDFVGHGHVEQMARVTGKISVGKERFHFDSVVNRDHSRGPRDFSLNRRHIWMHGTFENGISYLCYEAELSGKDAVFSAAAVYDGGKLYDAKLNMGFRLPFEGSIKKILDPVPFSIDYERGRLDIVADSFPTTLHGQATAPNDNHVGVRHLNGTTNTSYIEQSARYLLNGTIRGYGHMERTLPGIWLIEKD
jgi:hypothetical protein